jgi:hypothetical protein
MSDSAPNTESPSSAYRRLGVRFSDWNEPIESDLCASDPAFWGAS